MMKYIKIALGQCYVSKNFFEKLKHNFHELTILEKVFYFLFIRIFFSKEKRFFFEGSLLVPGQMYIGDRKAIYDIVIENKPRHCFEIGTYTGGGSTFFLASAFYKLGSGKVITLESDKDVFDRAVAFYKKHLKHLLPYVEFVYGNSFESFELYFKKYQSVDCFFLDGAEDSRQTKEQYLGFVNYSHSGTVLMAHDWNTEKTIDLKPLISGDAKWKKILEIGQPRSVGFASFKRM